MHTKNLRLRAVEHSEFRMLQEISTPKLSFFVQSIQLLLNIQVLLYIPVW